MNDEPKKKLLYAVFDKRESIIGSVIKDITTLAVLVLMVYVSRDSNWWTLVTGAMFILWMVAKSAVITGRRYKTFQTKEALQAWVDSL